MLISSAVVAAMLVVAAGSFCCCYACVADVAAITGYFLYWAHGTVKLCVCCVGTLSANVLLEC